MTNQRNNNFHNQIDTYKSAEEHINDELKLLDLRIQLLLERQRLQQGNGPLNQFKGLVILAEEAASLLVDRPQLNFDEPTLARLKDAIVHGQSYLHRKVELSLNQGVYLPLEYINWAFDLSVFERGCVLLALAVEYDRKYEKLFGFLQDDINCKYPTIDLAIKLLCPDDGQRQLARSSFNANSNLFKYLIELDDSAGGLRLSHPLKLIRRVLELFYHPPAVDPALSYIIDFYNPYDQLEPLRLDHDIQEHLRSWLGMLTNDPNTRKPLVVLAGPSGSGKLFQTQHLCHYFEASLLTIDLSRMPLEESLFERTLHDVIRESLLFGAIPCFRGLGHLTAGNNSTDNPEPYQNLTRWNILLRSLEELPGPIFILTEEPLPMAEFERSFAVLSRELGVPNELSRKELWELFAEPYKFDELPDWGQMASKFRFTPGQIKNALLQAHEATYVQGVLIKISDLYKACFNQGRHYLGRNATKVNPRYNWDDIILPPETAELLLNACNQMKNRYIVYGQWGFENRLAYGRGLSMLFSGLPGTGKTMAAQVIARELNLELYRIDLAQVVSKYIGETEKNLSQIFKEAESSNSILFFDEADALFGKRSEVKDAHDRYSNIEIAYLLQKVEEYDGISILATNLAKNMDDAFLRRITFIVEFPFPDAFYRRRIWLSMFPQQTPIHEDVDFDFLARRFEIAGGNIKNIVLAAAFLAAQDGQKITMHHLLRATKYEYQKIGRLLLREDLGEYYGEI